MAFCQTGPSVHSIVSDGDENPYHRASFSFRLSMTLGAHSWICARASVSPEANVGPGAVLGLGLVATRDLEPWAVYSGVPAVKMKTRVQHVPQHRGTVGLSTDQRPDRT